jgi:hypothetical protein
MLALTLERVVQLASVGIPELARFVKRSSDNLITVRVIERYGIHDVLVTLKGEHVLAGIRVPHLLQKWSGQWQ